MKGSERLLESNGKAFPKGTRMARAICVSSAKNNLTVSGDVIQVKNCPAAFIGLVATLAFQIRNDVIFVKTLVGFGIMNCSDKTHNLYSQATTRAVDYAAKEVQSFDFHIQEGSLSGFI
ncbi:hypothetical protein C7475_10148 [Chitinophaga sp. S165]|nr:hypothetical protein C7475_10148 [Chitinophaga sp. S165]